MSQSPDKGVEYSTVMEFKTHSLFPPSWKISFRYFPNGLLGRMCDPFLTDQKGQIIGYLKLETLSKTRPLPPVSTELISIGTMAAKGLRCNDGKMGSYLHRSCDTNGGLDLSCKVQEDFEFRFHNVLWIEWEDGIAYRKALGAVWADYWESTNKEEIRVKLG